MRYAIIMLAAGLLLPYIAMGYTPAPGSPLAKNKHPRLHITEATLPDFQARITKDYRSEYQLFVNWVDSVFNTDNDLAAGLMADNHALIFLLGPIPGITYQHTMSEYGARAIQIMLNRVANGSLIIPNRGYFWTDEYAKMARAYDWTWSLMTTQERTTIGNWIADAGISASQNSNGVDAQGKVNNLWSSAYYGAWFPWYYGLSIYGDGIRDADAQTLVDLFEERMLNGKWLDAQNWIGLTHGGISQIGIYGLWEQVTHIQHIDGWRTATGENYFSQGTSISAEYTSQYYPQFLLYRIGPHGKANPSRAGGYEWKIIKQGESSSPNLDVGYPTAAVRVNEVLASSGTFLKDANPTMAALNRWLLDNRTGDKMAYPNINIFQLLWGDRSVPAQSPQQLGLPTSQFFEGLGMAVMRTGFESVNDTAIVVMAPPYQLTGHDWLNYSGTPQGFTIDKYGPLALRLEAFYRSDSAKSNRNNQMRFTDPMTNPDGGFIPEISSARDVRNYAPGSIYDIGGMKRTEFDATHDYLYMDYTKYYLPTRVSKYTRQFVYLKPPTNTESDYIVIFDRAQTARPDIIKRWEISSAYSPQVNGTQTLVREGKWEYTNADQIAISNNIGIDPYSNVNYEGHGRLFVKSLLPEQKKIVKIGGPGHEFELDDGTTTGYVDADVDQAYLRDPLAGAYYTGTYRTDIVALGNNSQENFLHVLQTADANNPIQSTAMTSTKRVDGDTMVGAHIMDDRLGHKVAMFSRTEANQARVAYSISASAPVLHLIADLAPFGTYDVYQDSKRLATLPASEAGTLSFNSQGGGSFQISSNALPPTVVASAAPLSGNAPLTVSFTAVATDLDGTVQSYNWNFGDNTPNSSQQNPSHTYSVNGTFTATVTVTDNSGLTATSTVAITVTLPPKVTASANVKSGQVPLTVSFTAIGQNIVSYLWNFGDSQTGTQQNPTHIYQNSGTYTVKVTGTDSIGQVTNDTLTVVVYGTLQNIVITPSNTTVQINTSKQFTATGYDAGGNVTPIQAVWSVSGGGSIDENGLFTAGSATGGPFAITPQDQGVTATTTVLVTNLPSEGLVGYWSFDDGNGTTASDSSGNRNNGTLVNGPAWVSGKVGGALDFDGSDDYVDIPDSSSLTLSQVSVILWMKADVAKNSYLQSKGASSTQEYELRTGSDGSFLWIAKGSNVTAGKFTIGTWTQVAGTYDGVMMKLYVNGVQVGSKAASGALNSANAPLRIGSTMYGTEVFPGTIDDVRIYNRALRAAEIQQLANAAVPNQPPTVAVSAAPTSGTAPLTVTFTPTASDPDGTITTYAWDFGDSTTSTEQSPTHTYNAAGVYTAKVTVTDNAGAKATAEIGITVTPNQSPTVTVSATPTSGIAPLSVTFTATASDPDGTIASYAWDFGDQTTSTEQNPTHTYQVTGTYTAKVTVTDNAGATATAEIGITVTPNQPPTVAVTAKPTGGGAPLTVNFTATAQDPDGAIAGYAWEFGDNSTSTEQNPTHTYNAAGAYTAKVTVTDNAGATATAEIAIKVLGPPGKPVHKDAD